MIREQAFRCTGRLVALMVLLAGLSPTTSAQSGWQTQSIAPNSYPKTSPALIFDSQDRPQVVYSQYDLLYTHGTTAGAMPTWTTPVNTGISSSAGGTSGQAYLAEAGSSLYVSCRYYRYGSVAFSAATFDGTTWQPYTIPGVTSGDLTGLVVAGGQPYWLVNTAGGFSLASAPAGSTPVPVAPGRAGRTSGTYGITPMLQQGGQAVLDAAGNLHTVQFSDTGGGQLFYAKGPLAGPFTVTDDLESGWQQKTGRPSITIDAAGNPHIAYTQLWPSYGVKHLAWNGSGWDSEWIEQGGNPDGYLGTMPQVMVDPAGSLHVVYADLLNGLLKHAVKGAGGWTVEPIDQIGTQATYGTNTTATLTAAMDSRGGIGVAYWSAKDSALKYAYMAPEPASLLLLAVAGMRMLRRRHA